MNPATSFRPDTKTHNSALPIGQPIAHTDADDAPVKWNDAPPKAQHPSPTPTLSEREVADIDKAIASAPADKPHMLRLNAAHAYGMALIRRAIPSVPHTQSGWSRSLPEQQRMVAMRAYGHWIEDQRKGEAPWVESSFLKSKVDTAVAAGRTAHPDSAEPNHTTVRPGVKVQD